MANHRHPSLTAELESLSSKSHLGHIPSVLRSQKMPQQTSSVELARQEQQDGLEYL